MKEASTEFYAYLLIRSVQEKVGLGENIISFTTMMDNG